jgi:hypothetical protein
LSKKGTFTVPNSLLRNATRLVVFAGTLVSFALGAPLAAAAANNVAVFAGGQLDFANYVFAGVTIALPGSTIGSGVAFRLLGDTGGYDYLNGVGTVKASFGGGELDALYQVTHKNFWGDFGVGVNDTYTTLNPADSSNPLSGNQAELRITTDGGTASGPWRADWLGFYGTRLQDYEAGLDVTHSLSPIWRFGVLGYGEGNPNYTLAEVGPFAAVDFSKASELQFSTGEAWESGFPQPRLYFRAMIYSRL